MFHFLCHIISYFIHFLRFSFPWISLRLHDDSFPNRSLLVMAPYDAEARMTHKTFQRCKVTFFSPNISIICVNFLCQSQIIWTGKIILSARKQSMYQNKAWECVTSAIVNFPASRFQFIFRTAECTFTIAERIFTTAERTFRSAEYKTKACPYQIGTGLIIKFG